MKIYISHSSLYDYIDKIYEPIKKSNLVETNTFFFPHDNEDKIINTKQLIKEYDLVIAEVSIPATGQGIELGWADCANTPILCIYQENSKISSSLKFINNKFIEYKDSNDMINKITDFLKFIEIKTKNEYL